MRSVFPVLTVLAVILGLWWASVAPMNIRPALDIAERAGETVVPEGSVARRDVSVWRLMMDNRSSVSIGYDLDRPRLPTPSQVGQEFWKTTGEMVAKGRAFSKRSLIYHSWITLRSTFWGFLLCTTLGIIGAVAIVYSRVTDMSLMPWAIVSQTIPIVALAPMIIVLSNQVGIDGRGVPKAIISAYLCYFPVLVSMVKGLRSPDAMQMDLLHTYNATPSQQFWRLRLPSSVPYLFASLKIGIAASLVGAIVGELPVQRGGLGARMLGGSYYGQTEQIWAALIVAAVMAAGLVWLIGWIERMTLRAMGQQV